MIRAEWNDQKVEQIVGKLLQFGVLLAGAVVFIGGLLYLVQHGHEPVSYHTFVGEPPGLTAPIPVLHGIFALESKSIIQFGLLLLIATPVARVMLSVVAFGMERDHIYIIVTLVVLAILLYSLVWGGVQ